MTRASNTPQSELLYLVVDDNDSARQIVVEYLKAFGMEKIIESSSVEGAMILLEGNPVDFIISDWEMPGLSGLDFLRKLRRDARWKDLPFVMVTAPISHENLKIEQAAISEVDGYILKPFRANVLLEKIEEAIDECRERERSAAVVIDDDPEVRSLMVEMLGLLGYAPVFEASDGVQGYEILIENVLKVAIVVCDWEMPNKTGIELLQQIRIDRELASTPFLMVTSQGSIEQLKLQKAIEADVDHYLLKPFVFEEFRKKVKLIADKARISRKVETKLIQAVRAHHSGELEAASKLYKQTIDLDPKNIDAFLGLAHVKLNTSARSGFDECIQTIKRTILINPKLDRSYIALAMAFEQGFSLEKAILTLEDGIRNCPPSPLLYFESGRLLTGIGKHEEAFNQLQKALELKPDFAEAKKLQGDVSLRMAHVKLSPVGDEET